MTSRVTAGTEIEGYRPRLEPVERDGVAFLTDPWLEHTEGIVVAFSERKGGVSAPPFATLNLAAHVGDAAEAVDENRRRLLGALGLGPWRDLLTTAEQVHGDDVCVVDARAAGSGGFARKGGRPVPGADALVTLERGVPLMMLYADCVPVVLVATAPMRGVAVVHAGWRGALAGLPGKVARELGGAAGCGTSDLLAYIGPSVGPCHYAVDEERVSRFVDAFGTIARARGGLDLGAVVREDLRRVGVRQRMMARVGVCTAHETGRFFSYRAETVTGRHAAVAAILEDPTCHESAREVPRALSQAESG